MKNSALNENGFGFACFALQTRFLFRVIDKEGCASIIHVMLHWRTIIKFEQSVNHTLWVTCQFDARSIS